MSLSAHWTWPERRKFLSDILATSGPTRRACRVRHLRHFRWRRLRDRNVTWPTPCGRAVVQLRDNYLGLVVDAVATLTPSIVCAAVFGE